MKRKRALAFLAAFHPTAGNKHIKKCVDKNIQRKIVSYISEDEHDVPDQMCAWAACHITRQHKWDRRGEFFWFCCDYCKRSFFTRCCKCLKEVDRDKAEQYHPVLETVYETGSGVICNKCVTCRICGKTGTDKIIACPITQDDKILDVGWLCSEKCEEKFKNNHVD